METENAAQILQSAGFNLTSPYEEDVLADMGFVGDKILAVKGYLAIVELKHKWSLYHYDGFRYRRDKTSVRLERILKAAESIKIVDPVPMQFVDHEVHGGIENRHTWSHKGPMWSTDNVYGFQVWRLGVVALDGWLIADAKNPNTKPFFKFNLCHYKWRPQWVYIISDGEVYYFLNGCGTAVENKPSATKLHMDHRKAIRELIALHTEETTC